MVERSIRPNTVIYKSFLICPGMDSQANQERLRQDQKFRESMASQPNVVWMQSDIQRLLNGFAGLQHQLEQQHVDHNNLNNRIQRMESSNQTLSELVQKLGAENALLKQLVMQLFADQLHSKLNQVKDELQGKGFSLSGSGDQVPLSSPQPSPPSPRESFTPVAPPRPKIKPAAQKRTAHDFFEPEPKKTVIA